MFLHLLGLGLMTMPVAMPPAPAAFALVGHEDHGRQDRGRHEGEDRDWKHRDKEEEKYWKHERKWEKHRYHEDRDDDRDWDFDHPRHRHPAPPWMASWWRPGENHYCALVPGDPSRVYIFLDGRWVLRRVYDPRFRADISGAFSLPLAPPPVPPPSHLGLNLHIVLFN